MDSELGALMPNSLQQHQWHLASPTDTEELRQYVKGQAVLGERGNLPPLMQSQQAKQRMEDLHLRTGTGRVPPAKRFCIRIKRPDAPSSLPQDIHQLNSADVKEALLERALAQRRALLTSTLRAGTGRVPPRPQFAIRVQAPMWPQPPLELDALPDVEPVMAPTQLGQAKTPATSALAQYPSPMEGVPERVSGRRGRHAMPADQHTLVGSNLQPLPASSDSPVKGLMHQVAGPSSVQPQLVDMPDAFAFRPAPFPPPPPPHRTEMAVQTGTSLDGSARKDAAALAAEFDVGDDDDFGGGGFDDWGGGGGDDDDGYDGAADFGAPAEAAFMPPPPPKVRRVVRNPGSRLRGEVPRQSMAVDPLTGRQEVAPGIRRSMRSKQEPLMWWLGEKKNFNRLEHKTMPTVATVTHTLPNTPWRTIADPREWKRSRRYAKLGSKPKSKTKSKGKAAAESSDDEETEDEDEEAGADAGAEGLASGAQATSPAGSDGEETHSLALAGSEDEPGEEAQGRVGLSAGEATQAGASTPPTQAAAQLAAFAGTPPAAESTPEAAEVVELLDDGEAQQDTSTGPHHPPEAAMEEGRGPGMAALMQAAGQVVQEQGGVAAAGLAPSKDPFDSLLSPASAAPSPSSPIAASEGPSPSSHRQALLPQDDAEASSPGSSPTAPTAAADDSPMAAAAPMEGLGQLREEGPDEAMPATDLRLSDGETADEDDDDVAGPSDAVVAIKKRGKRGGRRRRKKADKW